MATRHALALLLGASLACSSILIGAATAQDDPAAALDALSRASSAVGPGTALAREQISRGDLTGAAATLERLLMDHPEPGCAAAPCQPALPPR